MEKTLKILGVGSAGSMVVNELSSAQTGLGEFWSITTKDTISIYSAIKNRIFIPVITDIASCCRLVKESFWINKDKSLKMLRDCNSLFLIVAIGESEDSMLRSEISDLAKQLHIPVYTFTFLPGRKDDLIKKIKEMLPSPHRSIIKRYYEHSPVYRTQKLELQESRSIYRGRKIA